MKLALPPPKFGGRSRFHAIRALHRAWTTWKSRTVCHRWRGERENWLMWGIIPAAGIGSRIQPLAFSKELLPVGSRLDGSTERPRAVSEYLVERMILAGATKLCFVISPGKSDILEYYGAGIGPATNCYMVQPHPAGLCDAVFRALPLIHPAEPVCIGLPDTIWFPEDGLCAL